MNLSRPSPLMARLLDGAYEAMVILWILLSPIAIVRWTSRFEDHATWAAFAAGLFGVILGWLVVAPQQERKRLAALQRAAEEAGES